MAAVSLFYDTNMATMTSCENILYMKPLLLVLFLDTEKYQQVVFTMAQSLNLSLGVLVLLDANF